MAITPNINRENADAPIGIDQQAQSIYDALDAGDYKTAQNAIQELSKELSKPGVLQIAKTAQAAQVRQTIEDLLGHEAFAEKEYKKLHKKLKKQAKSFTQNAEEQSAGSLESTENLRPTAPKGAAQTEQIKLAAPAAKEVSDAPQEKAPVIPDKRKRGKFNQIYNLYIKSFPLKYRELNNAIQQLQANTNPSTEIKNLLQAIETHKNKLSKHIDDDQTAYQAVEHFFEETMQQQEAILNLTESKSEELKNEEKKAKSTKKERVKRTKDRNQAQELRNSEKYQEMNRAVEPATAEELAEDYKRKIELDKLTDQRSAEAKVKQVAEAKKTENKAISEIEEGDFPFDIPKASEKDLSKEIKLQQEDHPINREWGDDEPYKASNKSAKKSTFEAFDFDSDDESGAPVNMGQNETGTDQAVENTKVQLKTLNDIENTLSNVIQADELSDISVHIGKIMDYFKELENLGQIEASAEITSEKIKGILDLFDQLLTHEALKAKSGDIDNNLAVNLQIAYIKTARDSLRTAYNRMTSSQETSSDFELRNVQERTDTIESSTFVGTNERISVKVNGKTKEFLGKLLTYGRLIKDDDPACLAINSMLNEDFKAEADQFALLNFLKSAEFAGEPNWTLLAREMGDGSEVGVNKAKNASLNDYKGLLQNLDDEKLKIDTFLKAIERRQSLNKDDSALQKEYLERLPEIEKTKREVHAAIQSMSKSLRYGSTREILGLMLVYKNQNERFYDIEELSQDGFRRIEREKNALYNRKNTLSKISRFAGSTLPSALKAMAQDSRLKTLGDNPAEELTKIGKLTFNTNNYTKVKEWILDLPGGIEKNIDTTLPVIVAYLESSLRKGNVIRMDRAKNLVRNLRRARDEHFRNEIAKENIKDPQERMIRYLQRLNAADSQIQDIHESNTLWNSDKVTSNTRKGYVKKLGVLAGGGFVAAASAPYLLGAGALGLGALAFKHPEKAKKILKGTGTALKGTGKGIVAVGKGAVIVGKPTVKVGAEATKRLAIVGALGFATVFTPWRVFSNARKAGSVIVSGKTA